MRVSRTFYVVQFIELPFEGIDDYVCVPNNWIIVRRAKDQKVVVAYPKDEDPFDTRDRAERKERYDDEWKFYMAVVKYESDNYRDAEFWIATRNDYGPLVEEELTVKDTQPKTTLNMKLPSANANRNHSKKSKSKKDKLELRVKLYKNLRKPLPEISIKRPALSECKEQRDEKRLKLDDAAKSTSAVANYANIEPECSRKERSIIIRDNHLMEIRETEETAAASNGENFIEPNKSLIQSDPSNMQLPIRKRCKQALSLPIIDVDESTEVITIDSEDNSRGDKQPNETHDNIQSHLFSNTTTESMKPPNSPTTAEQTSQSYQDSNQQHLLNGRNSFSNFDTQISDVRSIATIHNDQQSRIDDASNIGEKTFHHLSNSLKMSAQLYNHINGAASLVPIQKPIEKKICHGNIAKTMAIALQNPSNLMNQTRSLSTRSLEKEPSMITQNQSQDSPRVPEMRVRNCMNATAPLRGITNNTKKNKHIPRINVRRSHDVTAVDPRISVQNDANAASATQNHSSLPHQHPSFVHRLDGQRNLPAPEEFLQQTMHVPDMAQRPSELQNINQRTSSEELLINEAIQRQFNQAANQPSEYFPRSHQNSYLPVNQDNLQQEQYRKERHSNSTESNNVDHRSKSRTIRMRIPSIRQNSTNVPNPLYQTSELSQQKHLESNHQDLQWQPRTPTIRIGISIRPKVNKQMPTLQGVKKRTPPPVQSKVINSIRQVVSTTRNNYLLNQQQSQASLSGRSTEQNNTGGATSTEAVTDHEVTSDHEMSTYEVHVQTPNDVDCTGISTESNSHKPTAIQNSTSTNHQPHPRVVLEQQMLDNFATLLNQMGSTLQYTCDMYNNLRSSILETAETYQSVLDAVERFNMFENSASNVSYSTADVAQVTEEKQTEVAARENSCNNYQHGYNVVNEAPKKKHNNLWRFDLPPEYDPQDTRWTLKYPKYIPGLVELMPQSGIYVSYGDLKYCQQVSTSCKSLMIRLLSEVFNRKALSVCLTPDEKAKTSNNMGFNVRPELNEHAISVLLNFVLEHGLQCGWNIDIQTILTGIHSKIKEIRFKYGVMVKY